MYSYPSLVADRSPDVDDAFVFVSWHDNPAAHAAAAFESGRILVIHDFPYGPGSALQDLMAQRPVPITIDDRVKKASVGDLIQPIHAGFYSDHVLSGLFPDDAVAATAFRREVGLVTARMQKAARTLFPSYRFTGRGDHSWRYTETSTEGLHLDSFGDGFAVDAVRLRVFVNTDVFPRVWRVGRTADAIYRSCRDSRGAEWFRAASGRTPNEVNQIANAMVPAGPAHTVLFSPGSLWICDTQWRAHQVVAGRRAWTYMYEVDAASLNAPETAFDVRARRTLAALSAGPG